MTYKKYYKKGLTHFLFKKVMRLEKPTLEVKLFYIVLLTLILTLAIVLT